MSSPPLNASALPDVTYDLILLDEEEEEEKETTIPMIAMLVGDYSESLYNKSPVRDSTLQGIDRVNELMNGHPRCFQEQL